MPGSELLGPGEGRGLLPWSWAEERLRESRNYWLSTVSPDGEPHAMAVWGVWHEEGFFFSTGTETRKTRNLARSPACVVTTEDAAEAVVMHGVARRIGDPAVLSPMAQVYREKYAMGYPPDSHVYRVEPRKAFGFIEDAAHFAGAATRWEV